MEFNPAKFKIKPENKKPEKMIKAEVKELLIKAIEKLAPDDKFGILFSGGVDSSTIAYICKTLKKDFVCYTAALSEEGMKEAEDLIWAKMVAKEYGLNLRIKILRLNEVENYIKKISSIINSTNVVKIGVGLPVFLGLEMAKKDGIRHVFTGLGSEEIFAGYERHRVSEDINKECLRGLLSLEERDFSRDEPIADHFNIKLLLPYLDEALVDYTLKVPEKYKLNKTQNKIILRKAALDLGLKKEFAERKKRAAQYGSKFDRAIKKLAKTNGFKYKKDYLDSFKPMLGALVSGGKDSLYAMYKMQKSGYKIGCIIKIISENPDSYMFHTPAMDMIDLQAESLGIPLIEHRTKGIKEEELKDLKNALKKAKDRYGIQGISTGALYSSYQKDRIGKLCDDLNLEAHSPLWHMDQEEEMREIIDKGFDFIFTSIAADGLDKSWLGRKITKKDIDALSKINKKIGLNIAGEGGEFESLVLDMPNFSKKIKIEKGKILMEKKHTGEYIIEKAVLAKK